MDSKLTVQGVSVPALRGIFAAAVIFVFGAAAQAQQSTVTFSENFQSYGKSKKPAGWIDTKVGSLNAKPRGYYKTRIDPTQDNHGSNIVYGTTKSTADKTDQATQIKRGGYFAIYQPKIFSASGRFEVTGRMIRAGTSSRAGLTVLSGYPEKDKYYLIREEATGTASPTLRLNAFGAGTPTGTVDSHLTLTPNKWYRFRIATDSVGSTTFIRARFWLETATEPTTWSIDAADSSAARLTAGRFGLWAGGTDNDDDDARGVATESVATEDNDDDESGPPSKGTYVDDLNMKSPADIGLPTIELYENGVKLDLTKRADFNRNAAVEIRVADDLSTVTYTATLDNAVYRSLDPIAAEGTHLLKVHAVDAVGNAADAQVSILIDKTAPAIALLESGQPLADNAKFKRNAAVEIRVTDALSTSSYTAKLDANAYVSLAPISAEGAHVLLVEAVDAVGNRSTKQVRIVIDKTAPAVTFYESGHVVDSATAKFKVNPAIEIRGTDTLTVATVTATLDGNPYTSLTPITVDGRHTIVATATDEAGNSATQTLNLLVDKVAPVVVLLESSNVLDLSKTAVFNRNAAIDVRVTDATSQVQWSAKLDNVAYTPLTPIAQEAAHTVTVHATDEAGNVTDVTFSVLVDKTAPVVTFREGTTTLDPRADNLFRRDVAIEIKATDATSTATFTATLNGAVYHSLDPIVAEGPHTIVVHAVDTAGNVAVIGVELKLVVDKTRPVIALSESGTALPSGSQRSLSHDAHVAITVTDNLPGVTYTAKLDGSDYASDALISLEGTHALAVHAVDAAGNEADATATLLIDKTGPAISFLVNGTELAQSEPKHKFKVRPAIEIRIADTHSTTTSTAKLDGADYTSLTPVAEGIHTLTVHAVDALGNPADATLALLVDLTAPVVVVKEGTNLLPLTGGIFAHDLAITATATDLSDTDVKATLDELPFSLTTPVAAEGPHTLRVTATDELLWATTVTSTFTIDKTAPKVTVREGTSPLLDDHSFARDVTLTATADDITTVTYAATLDGQPYILGTVITADGTHTISVIGTDAAGNHSAAETVRFHIERANPEVRLLESGQPFTDGKSLARDVKFTIEVTAATATTNVVKIDGAAYTLGAPYGVEGQHHLSIVVTSAGGRSTPVDVDFEVDKTRPTIRLMANGAAMTNDQTFDADLTPVAEADDNLTHPPVVVVTLDGHSLGAGTVVSEEKVHTISATATDRAGNSFTAGPLTFVLDKTNPTVTVTVDGQPLANGDKFKAPITPAIVPDDLTPTTVAATLDNVAYTVGAAISDDGSHTLVVKVTDRLGHSFTLPSITFIIDKTAPVVTVLESDAPFVSGSKYKRPVTPTLHIVDTTETIVTATLDGNAYTAGQAITSEGRHVLAGLVTDELGWSTPIPTIAFTIDGTEPVVEVREGANLLVTGTIFNRDVQPRIVVTDATETVTEATLDGALFASNTLITAEGAHVLAGKVTDELGLFTPILPISFIIDKTAPVVTIKEAGETFADHALLNHDAVPLPTIVDITEVVLTATLDNAAYVFGTPVTAEGPHTLVWSARDAAGWTTLDATIHFVIDKTAPVVAITDGGAPLVSGVELGRSVTPVITITDLSTTTTVATLDNVAFTSGTVVAAEGIHTLVVTVTDAAGWPTTVPPITFTIDKTAPVVRVLESGAELVSGTKFNRAVLPQIVVTDSTATTTVATLGNATYLPDTLIETEGTLTLSITVTDRGGNSTPVPPITFVIDRTPPVVTITESGQPLTSGSAFKRNVKPEIAVQDITQTTTAAQLNGAPFAFGTELTEERRYALSVTVTDELGWPTTVPTIGFAIDRTAPVVQLVEDGKPLTSGSIFNHAVEPRAVIDDVTDTTVTATLNGAQYQLGTKIEVEGEYTLNVHVVDAVGLFVDVPAVTFRIDTTKPVLSFITPTNQQNLTTPRVLVTGNSDDAVSVEVDGVAAEVDRTAKRFTIPSLELLEGTNTIVAVGTDAAGNVSDPVSVEVAVDTRAPEVTITSPAANACVTTRQLQISGTVTDPHVQSVSVAILPGTAAAVNATLSDDHRTWSAALQFPAEGKFVLAVTARDNGGHESMATVQVRIDETKPRIEITESGVPFTAPFVNHNVAPFVRAVDADPNATLTVTLDGAPYVSGTPIVSEKNFEPYELKATSTDCAGNKSDDTIVRFVIDRTPPQFGALSPANGASIGSIPAISGSVSPDTAAVLVEESGASASLANGAFTFGGLTATDGVNRFTLVAVDRAGNRTRLDYSFTVKTAAPTVEISENGSPIAGGTRYNRAVTVDVVSNEAGAVIAATHNGQPFTSGTTIADNGSHTIVATARDSFGHTSPAKEVTFTIDREGPIVTIAEPQAGATVTAASIHVRGTVTGDPVSATIDGSPLTVTAGAFDAEVALETGPNEIVIVALDAAGNAGTASVDVTRGGGTLGLVLNSPVAGAPTNRRTTTVAGQVLTPAGVSFVTVNGIEIPIDAAGAFRKTDFALTEGQNVITAIVRKNGAEGSVSVTVVADFTPPVVTVRESGTPLDDESRFATRAEIAVTATDGGQGLTPTLLIDAAAAVSPVTITATGGHTLVAVARDAAGNETRVERTFFIGSAAAGGCAVTDFDPANNSLVTSDRVTLVGRTGGAAGVKVNGTAAVVSNGSFSATVNLPSEGANSITINCTDANGAATGTPVTITLTRATGAPSVTITDPDDNSVSANELITVRGTISGEAAEVLVNGSAATISGGTFTASNVRLASGVNVVVARARNAAGRTATDSARVTWLKNLPAITITSPAAAIMARSESIDVSGTWTNLDPASLTVTRGGSAAPVQTAVTSDTAGTFSAAAVPLTSGLQTITVRGLDRLGRAATATIEVTRADGKPSIAITQPADNAYFGAGAGATFTVHGSFSGDAASTVEVNGQPATIDASASTFTAEVAFSSLLSTPVVARVTEPAGNSALDTVRVSKLGSAPTILETFPEADAVDVDAGALPLVLFSAPMDRASVRAAFRLENAAGAPVSGDVTLDRDVLTFAPATLLVAGEHYTIRIATSAQDLGGNALGTAFARSFTVTATAPVTAPSLNAYATHACGTLDLSGTAPADARVRIDLGTLSFNTTASAAGAFTFKLPLSGRSGFQVARVRVAGSDGSLSAAAEAQFEVDCAGPQVTNATYDRTANALTITFSKAIDVATVTTGATGSVRLQLADGTIAGGTVSALAAATSVSITPAQNLTAASFTLTITTAVKDTTGAALTSAYTRAFTTGEPTLGNGAGYISGEIFDADTGRPLPGATVSIEVPVGAFLRGGVRSDDVTATSTSAAITDNRGRYLRELPEGAHTIRASADGYTTVWRQIIVRTGAGVIPTDIRLTPRGTTKPGNGGALVLAHGGVPVTPLALPAELNIPAAMVATGNSVTLTSIGAQSLAGLLPLGWSPLAAAEIVSNAPSLSGSELTFTVPASTINNAGQTLTAVRYFDDRDEWRVVTAVVTIAGDKATIPVAAAGAYALVYPDKDPRLARPADPTAGGALAGVTDPCTTETCPPLAAKQALQLVPPVVLPTQRTVATLRIEGANTSHFPSGTAVQAYVDEELKLADGTRDVVAPFATDLLLYRTLTGETGEALFHLAPSARASEVVLEIGYDHIRIVPYPERLDRGTLIGPEGGRVPADDRVAVEIPAGATTEALQATATSITNFASYGSIAGYHIVGGLALSLQWAGQGSESSPVELTKPARATFTVPQSSILNPQSQLVLAEVLEGTPYGRIFRLASQITALEGGGRFSTKPIDRAVLPVDGIVREGHYLLLAADAPIAFATGSVHLGLNGPATAGARVLTPSLGVIDLTRITGIFNVPVPAAVFSLVPRTLATGDGATYTHPTAPAAGAVVNVGVLSIVQQPPTASLTVFSHRESGLVEVPAAGATEVTPSTSVKASFSPGLDPQSVRPDSISVIDDANASVVPGSTVAQGSTALLWTLAPGSRLRADATYTAVVSPNVRGTNGTPLGTAATATFATVTTLNSPNVDASKIRITMPDANGHAQIIGAPGALKEHWNAVAIRRGRDFSNHPQDDADAQRSFLIELGTGSDPANRVTIADVIYLQIINDAGAVAAIVQLGPFTTEDGRGFVARADADTRYTTPDNVTVAVPAGAFDVPTIVSVHTAAKSAVADVPGFDEELAFHAGFKIDFEGIAKKRLDISFPAPASLPANQSAYLGYYGQSSQGPRIMLIDLLRRDGSTLTTTVNPQSSILNSQSGRGVASNAIVNPTVLRDMLLGIDRGAIIIGFTFQTSVNFITFAPPPVPLDFFIPPIKSLYFASFAVERDRILVPVPAGVPFHIIGVDPGSGYTVVDASYTARAPGEPEDAGDVTLPSTNDRGPYPVFTNPGRTEIVDLNADDIDEDESIRNLKFSFDGSTFSLSSGTTALPANTRLEMLNLRSGSATHTDDFAGGGLSMAAQKGDRIVLLIGERDIDPASAVTVVFNEPIEVGTDDEMREQFKLLVADPAVMPLSFQPVPGLTDVHADSGGRRISVVNRGGFQRGKVYRLELSTNIVDRDPTNPLKLGQNAGGSAPGDLYLEFAVRAPKGLLNTFDISDGVIRDVALSGNILLVSALDGGILAYDISNPVNIGAPIGTVKPPVGSGSQTWAVAADDHGRVYATAVSPMYGVVRSYRIEDFYCGVGGASCPSTPEQKGNAIITWRTGINVGMPLASMMIGGWPEAIPRKMQIVTKDEDPEISTFEDLTGGGTDIGGGFFKATVTVSPTSFEYGKQRITIRNVTRNYSWSADVDSSGTGSITIIGQAEDEMHVIRNLSTIGVISLFGHGVGVYDLNAVDANYRHVLDSTWQRLQDTLMLDSGDGGSCGDGSGVCDRVAKATAGKSCDISDLAFSPDAALVDQGGTLSVFALEQNKGVVQLDVTPTASAEPPVCGRAGSLVLAEKIFFPNEGFKQFGHPRLNQLRRLYKAATGREPSGRFSTVATFRREGDTYALVTGWEYGILVLKTGSVLNRSSLVDVIWVPNGAQSIRVMQEHQLAAVVDGKGRVLLVNLAQIDESDKVASPDPACGSIDCEWELYPTALAAITATGSGGSAAGADDPRIVWSSPDTPGDPLVFGTLAPLLDPETGFLFAGSLTTKKMRVVSAVDPRVRFIAQTGTGTTPGAMKTLESVVPLGVEPVPGSVAGPNGSLGAFRLEVTLPGSMQESLSGPVNLEVQSEIVLGAAAPQTPLPLPRARLKSTGARPVTNLQLRHDAPQSSDPEVKKLRYQRGWNRMVSPWILAIADPRATKDYTPSGTVPAAAGCGACDRPAHLQSAALGTDYFEIWSSGRVISVKPDTSALTGTPYEFLTEHRRFDARVNTIPADLVRPSDGATDIDKIAGKNLPLDGTLNEEVVAVNTGEVVRGTTDLTIHGRGMDFDLTRYYSSAITHLGPFGRNFDSPLFARVQTLPNGDVAFYDGTGRKDVFTGGTTPPAGVFVSLRRGFDGNVVVGYPDNTQLYFDGFGRLSKMTDRNTTRIDGSDGNAMRLLYGANGKLATVVDPTGRSIKFDYYASSSGGGYEGCIWKVTDFDGRVVEYTYDASARIKRVVAPDPGSASSAQPSTEYDWTGTPTTGAKQPLYASGQITAERDGLARTVWSAGYNSAHPWSAETLTSGTGSWTVTLNSDNTTVVDPSGQSKIYARNGEGRIASAAEAGGAVTTYGYDQGRVKSITRPLGDKTEYGYGAASSSADRRAMLNVESITEHPVPGSPEATAGMTRVTTVQYGPANLPIRIVSPDGAVTSVPRDARGNPQSITDPTGVTSIVNYDLHGLLTSVTDPRRGTTTYGYVTSGIKEGYPATVTAPAGMTQLNVDNRGNIVQETTPGGQITMLTVNKLDQLERQSTGSSVSTMTYDAAQNLKTRNVLAGTDPSGAPVFDTSTYQIDALGRMTTQVEDGVSTTYGYDPAGRVKTLDRTGAALITYGYDNRGRLFTVTEGARTTTYGYDLNGHPSTITDPRGKVTSLTPNGFGQSSAQTWPTGVTQVEQTDAAGRPVDSRLVKLSTTGDPLLLRWTTREYDPLGRITKEVQKLFTNPLVIPKTGDPSGATDVVTRTSYDDTARRIVLTDPRGSTSTTELDDQGRVIRGIDALGNLIEISYDMNGNKASETRTDRGPENTRETFTTRYSYDGQNRLVGVTDNSGRDVMTCKYDERGNRTEQTDAEGNIRRFEYDVRGNMIKDTVAGRGTTEYHYDALNHLQSIRDANGNQTSFTYDTFGNVMQETRADGATWSFVYDDNGNLRGAVDANGTAVTYDYDDNDRVIARRISKSANVLGPALVTFAYDDLGRMIASETSEGVKTTRTFDSLDRELSEDVQIGNGPKRSVLRGYDPAGYLTSLTYPSGLSLVQTIDGIGRIGAVAETGQNTPIVRYTDVGARRLTRGVGNGVTTTWSYDAMGRLAGIDERLGGAAIAGVTYERTRLGNKSAALRPDIGKQWRYAYDRNAWLTSETIERADSASESVIASTDYAIDPLLNYKSIVRIGPSSAANAATTVTPVVNDRNQYTSFGGAPISYDANGNMKELDGATLQYDYENRLVHATLASGAATDYVYDAEGRKVAERLTVGGSSHTTEYVINDLGVIEEYVDGVLASRYVRGRGIDEIARAEIGGAAVYPLQDELGSVERLTDAAGATLERYEYQTYGRFTIFDANGLERSVSAVHWPWLFQGRPHDPLLNAYDFRARTLWPELGRFGQEDPAGSHRDLSSYQAFLGASNTHTDPTGNYEEDVHHYLTQYLAEVAGVDRLNSLEIGFATQALDMDSRDAMWGGVSQENMVKYHFVDPVRLNQMKREAAAGTSLDDFSAVRAIGEFLHAWEDSYAHQADRHRRDFSQTFHDHLGTMDIGHGYKGHTPDWTWDRPELAMTMAEQTHRELVTLCKKYLGKQCATQSFSTVRGRVLTFVNFRPKTYEDLIYGQSVDDVIDYSDKVHKLDPTYVIDPDEIAKRHTKYQAYLQREAAAKREHERALQRMNNLK